MEEAVEALAKMGAADGRGEEGRPPELSARDRDREVHDLLGYLRDFSQGGAFSSQRGPEEGGGRHSGQDGSHHPLWESPFSEN